MVPAGAGQTGMTMGCSNPGLKTNRMAQVARLRGTVLLEVVLSLGLFLFAVAIISGGMQASVAAVDRLRVGTHALNLAISVMSEIQLGIKDPQTASPEPFLPPFQDWTWEVQANPVGEGFEQNSNLQQVEVIVRQSRLEVVHRLTQLLPVNPAGGLSTNSFASSATPR